MGLLLGVWHTHEYLRSQAGHGAIEGWQPGQVTPANRLLRTFQAMKSATWFDMAACYPATNPQPEAHICLAPKLLACNSLTLCAMGQIN